MNCRKYGTIEKAVLSELNEERMARWEHYTVWFVIIWLLVMIGMILYTQNYCEMMKLDALVREQEMINSLMFRVLWF